MFQLITIYKSYILWLHFLEYPNISERCIKIVINEMIWCQIFCLKKTQCGIRRRGGMRECRWNEVGRELVIAEAGSGSKGLIILFSPHFYIFEILHNKNLEKKKKRKKAKPLECKTCLRNTSKRNARVQRRCNYTLAGSPSRLTGAWASSKPADRL